MLGSIGRGFKWVSDKWGAIATASGLLLFPFFGMAANFEKLRNPDASFWELGSSFWKGLVTDPKNILTLSPDQAVPAAEIATGASGVLSGLGGILDGWGAMGHKAAVSIVPFFTETVMPGTGTILSPLFNQLTGKGLGLDNFVPTPT